MCLACAPTHAATPLATAHRLTHRVSTRVETGEPEQAETAQPTTQRQCPNRREHPAPCVTLCNWKSCAHTNNSSLGRSHARRRLQLWYTHRTVVGAGAPALSLSHSHKLSKHTGKHTDISSRAAHSSQPLLCLMARHDLALLWLASSYAADSRTSGAAWLAVPAGLTAVGRQLSASLRSDGMQSVRWQCDLAARPSLPTYSGPRRWAARWAARRGGRCERRAGRHERRGRG